MAEEITAGSESIFDVELWPALLAAASGADFAPPCHINGSRAEWDLYAAVAQSREAPAYVVGQLGQSLDGRIATASGNSHYINGPEAIRHLHRLRALVDAVIVGVGTVISDDPRLTVRHGLARQSSAPGPARIVIDPNGRLPPDALVLADDGVPVYVVQHRRHIRSSRMTAITLAADNGSLDPKAIVAAVAALGYRRILVEGGATTISAFLAAGAIDRLHLCIAPLVIGSGKMGINLPPVDRLEHALRPAMSVHRLGCDTLFDCVLTGQPAADETDNLVLKTVES